MAVFLFTVGYFLIISICVLLVIRFIALIKFIREKKYEIDELDSQLYSELRELQFKSKNITRYSSNLLKHKNSITGEFCSSLFISLLPFKKIKSLLFINKLAKRIF